MKKLFRKNSPFNNLDNFKIVMIEFSLIVGTPMSKEMKVIIAALVPTDYLAVIDLTSTNVMV